MTEILRAAARPSVAWANGAGATTEVARSTSEPFEWRVSIATIDRDAPFSALPGVDRILVPLSADGLTLVVNGARVALGAQEPLAFAGEDDVASIGVSSVSLDLNVMTRRRSATGALELQPVDGRLAVDATRGTIRIIVVLGAAGLLTADGTALLLHDAILVRGGLDAPVEIAGHGLVAIITIREAGEGKSE